MIHPDKEFILHPVDKDRVLFIRRFRFRRKQLNPMTLNDGFAHGLNDISAYGTDVEF